MAGTGQHAVQLGRSGRLHWRGCGCLYLGGRGADIHHPSRVDDVPSADGRQRARGLSLCGRQSWQASVPSSSEHPKLLRSVARRLQAKAAKAPAPSNCCIEAALAGEVGLKPAQPLSRAGQLLREAGMGCG